MNKQHYLSDEVQSVVSSYSRATGVYCLTLEPRTSSIPDSLKRAGIFPSCHSCTSNHASEKSHSSKEPCFWGLPNTQSAQGYIYLCASGFAFFGAPIYLKDEPIVNVFACSALTKNEKECIGLHEEMIKKTYPQDPKYLPKRIRDLSELLLHCCQLLSQPKIRVLASHEHTHTQEGKNSTNPHYDAEEVLDSLCYQKELLEHLESISSNEEKTGHIFNITHTVLHLASWLTDITGNGEILETHILDKLLKELKAIEVSHSVVQLKAWILYVGDLIYTEIFKLHSSQHADVLVKALRCIHEGYTQELSMQTIADDAQVSYSYFSRIFKKAMGVTFNEYINNLRIQKSKKLLTSTNKGLLEISHMCGFSDQSYYTKIFKRVVGMNPRKFRESSRISFQALV